MHIVVLEVQIFEPYQGYEKTYFCVELDLSLDLVGGYKMPGNRF